MTAGILSFPIRDPRERCDPATLEPNAPLLLVLDADLAATDITVDLARRKLTLLGVANACRAAEQLWNALRAEEQRLT